MSTYKAIVLTKLPNANGYVYNPEVLKEIVEQDPTVPVTINFNKNSIGKTNHFQLTQSGEVLCTFEVNIPNLNELNLFAVPGGFCYINDMEKLDEGKVTLIKKFNLTEISLTSTPADMSLSSIDLAE